MTDRVRIDEAAREELFAAADWYDERRPNLGDEVLAEFQRTVELIERHPRLGTPVARVPAERGTRRLALQRFPYAVVYRERDEEIQVVAFAHQSRKPVYWRSR